MQPRTETLVVAALLLAAAFASWGLWLGEVVWLKGWAGIAWLSGFNWSAIPIAAIVAVACSYAVSFNAPGRGRRNFVALAFALALVAFIFARAAGVEVLSSWGPNPLGLLAIGVIVLMGIAVAAGFTAAASRWLAQLHWWTAALVLLALLLVIPLSFATIKVFPALNGSVDQVHAIKMGYPPFWVALLLPLALRLGRRRKPSG
jgi:hypothetical protein